MQVMNRKMDFTFTVLVFLSEITLAQVWEAFSITGAVLVCRALDARACIKMRSHDLK